MTEATTFSALESAPTDGESTSQQQQTWHISFAEGLQRTVSESADSAVRSARSLQQNSSSHLSSLQVTVSSSSFFSSSLFCFQIQDSTDFIFSCLYVCYVCPKWNFPPPEGLCLLWLVCMIFLRNYVFWSVIFLRKYYFVWDPNSELRLIIMFRNPSGLNLCGFYGFQSPQQLCNETESLFYHILI